MHDCSIIIRPANDLTVFGTRTFVCITITKFGSCILMFKPRITVSFEADILFNEFENYILKTLPHLPGANEFIKSTGPNVMSCILQHLEAGHRPLWVSLWGPGNLMHRNDSFTVLWSIIMGNHQSICRELGNCKFDTKCVNDCDWVKCLQLALSKVFTRGPNILKMML